MTKVTENEIQKETREIGTTSGRTFVLVREQFGDDPEKPVYAYCVEGRAKGKDGKDRIFKVTVVPTLKVFGDGDDRKTESGFNAYQALDLIYTLSNEVYLEQRTYSYTDSKGEIREGTQLFAVGIDPMGQTIDVPVKPYGKGDEYLLKMLVSGFAGIEDNNRHKLLDHSAPGNQKATPVEDGELPF